MKLYFSSKIVGQANDKDGCLDHQIRFSNVTYMPFHNFDLNPVVWIRSLERPVTVAVVIVECRVLWTSNVGTTTVISKIVNRNIGSIAHLCALQIGY